MNTSLLIQLALAHSAPLLLAALGGIFSERSGVANIGLEGMMLFGAFGAVLGSGLTGSALLGAVAGMIAGALLATVHGVACIHLEADHIVSGAAINILALGLSGFLLTQVYATHGSSPAVPGLAPFWAGENLPVWLDWLAPLLRQTPVGLAAFLAVPVSIWLLYRTRLGLRLRAAGENPEAVRANGISVARLRWYGVLTSGLLAGLAGAQISIGDLSRFVEKMTAGRGFIALAALIIGRWRPGPTLAACVFLGLTQALADYLQVSSNAIPEEFLLALPYVLTLLALGGFYGRSVAPAALGKPFHAGD